MYTYQYVRGARGSGGGEHNIYIYICTPFFYLVIYIPLNYLQYLFEDSLRRRLPGDFACLYGTSQEEEAQDEGFSAQVPPSQTLGVFTFPGVAWVFHMPQVAEAKQQLEAADVWDLVQKFSWEKVKPEVT